MLSGRRIFVPPSDSSGSCGSFEIGTGPEMNYQGRDGVEISGFRAIVIRGNRQFRCRFHGHGHRAFGRWLRDRARGRRFRGGSFGGGGYGLGIIGLIDFNFTVKKLGKLRKR
jgi:hypothetical protein